MNLWRSKLGVIAISIMAVAIGFYAGRPLLDWVQFARAASDVQATREQLSTVEDLSTVFRHVGKVIEPSVVNISIRKTVKETHPRVPDSDPLRKFFREPGDVAPNPDDGADGDEYEQRGTGSGVIMEAADGYGYILTNNHVAGGATEMDITLADGREFTNGKLLGADAKSDLAVVKIKADRLIPAKWGNSDDLEKGDWVLAFGSPLGYIGSMTHGIVSALNRHEVGILGSNGYENFIQVDAPINPGNSGGPLVNIRGEVVGINTAIATKSGGFQGIGFAIPSNQAKIVYNALKERGKVVRGWLGVGIFDVAKDLDTAQSFGYDGTTGVLVEQIFPGTPSTDKLRHGDVIVRFNNDAVESVQQLRNLVAATPPDTKVTLKVFRDKKMQDVEITMGNQPDDVASILGHGGGEPEKPNDVSSAQTQGMTLQSLDAALSAKLGMSDLKSGAVITDVARNSTAAKAGLRGGDVIVEVGDTTIHSAKDAADAINKADLKKGVRLYLATREGSHFIFLKTDETAH